MTPQTILDQQINTSYLSQNQCHMVARLGTGGMSEILLGVQRKEQGFERLIVVKKYTTYASDEPHALSMFVDEARIIAALNHPHIVKIIDFGQDNGQVCILMEYVDGETLRFVSNHLKKHQQRMPLPIVLQLISQCCDALCYLHEEKTSNGLKLNLIHRDIDLQNLMVDRNGYLKIIDFGIAKSTLQSELTSPGLLKGKLPYLCPDVFYHRDIDIRVDIYALGLAFFELCTSLRPFDFHPNLSIDEVVKRIVTTELTPPSQIVPGLPPELDALILKATKKDREQRFQSAHELFQAIQSFAASFAKIASPHEVKAWFQSEFRERIAKRREFERHVVQNAEGAFASGLINPPSSNVNLRMNTSSSINAPTEWLSTMPFTTTNNFHNDKPRQPEDRSSVRIKRTHLYALLICGLLIVLLGGMAFWLIYSSMNKRHQNQLRFQLEGLSQQMASMNEIQWQEQEALPAKEKKESPVKQSFPSAAPTSGQTPLIAGMSHSKTESPEFASRHNTPTDEVGIRRPESESITWPRKVLPSRKNVSPIDKFLAANSRSPSSEAREDRPIPDKLLSATGSWNGAQTVKRGCAHCHKKKLDWNSKTRGQWRFFFLKRRHDRYADLERYFSPRELRNAELYILRHSEPAKSASGGVSGAL